MKTQHTPGPWRITAHDALRGTFEVNAGPEGYSRIQIAMGIQGEANASLIASAPALMAENARLREALTELLARCEPTVPGDYDSEEDCNTILKARAALQGGGL